MVGDHRGAGLQADLAPPGGGFHEVMDALRERGSVQWRDEQGGFWMVLGHEEVRTVLADAGTFSSRSTTIPAVDPVIGPDLPKQCDPPEHLRHRRLATSLLTAERWSAVADDVATLAVGVADAVAGRGEGELVTDLTAPFAHGAYAAFLGLPPAATTSLARTMPSLAASGTRGTIDPALVAHVRRTRIMRDLLEREQVDGLPVDGIVAAVRRLVRTTGSLTIAEGVGHLRMLYEASVDVVAAQLGLMVELLLRSPGLAASIADPAGCRRTVAELLRADSSIALVRTVTRRTELGGAVLEPDQMVLAFANVANRDPAAFGDAGGVRPDREDGRPSLVFGAGPHRCPGALMGTGAIEIALRTWFAGAFAVRSAGRAVFSDPPHRQVRSCPIRLHRRS